MKKFATADCETDPFKFMRVPKPFIWGFYTENEFQYFYETKDFVDYIKNYKGIIYFHNGGKFDIHFLLEYVTEQDKIMVINGRIAKIKIGLAEIRDSYLLLPVPLSAYKKDEIDYNKMELENRKANMNEIVSYLEGDCKYLYEILEKQFQEYGQKLTLASSAFDFWFKEKSNLKYKPQTSRYYFEQFKSFYYGGRVECFKKGIIEKEFQVFDINSAYPYAMQFNHAYGNEYECLNKLPSDLELCFCDIEAISSGGLPFRDKTGLKFPNDNIIRNYKVTGYEIKNALELNKLKIIKINRIYKFLNSISFKDYVEHFYKLKSELKGVDDAKYLLAKLYLNSLYGKFGQSSLDHREYELIDRKYIAGYIEAGFEYEGEIFNFALMSKIINDNKMKFYNVATAASITGFVRAYLFKNICNVINPIYCDTDSLACEGFKGTVGKELGEWEKEGDFERGAIGGKKLYAFKYKNQDKYKISSKGARLNQKEIFSIANGEEIIYKNIAPTFSLTKQPNFVVRKIRLT